MKTIAGFYHFSQVVPASTWYVEHNLSGYGGQVPSVTVALTIDGAYEVAKPDQVTIIDENHLTITFSAEQTGYANIIV